MTGSRVEREFCARKLVNFVRRAWPVVEPGTPYVHGWHIDAIAEHLEAVSAGEINRLLINVPPGHDEVARRRRALAGLGVGTAGTAAAALRRRGARPGPGGARQHADAAAGEVGVVSAALAARPRRRPGRQAQVRERRDRLPGGGGGDGDDRAPRRPGALRRPALGRGRALRPAAQDRAPGVLRDGDHPAQLAGALGDRRRHAAAARAGPVGPHPRARARLRAPLPADGVRGRPPLHHLDRLPRSARGGRRASVPGALPGRGGGARQAGDGRARHRRAVPAAPDPARRRHVPDRPLRARRSSARACGDRRTRSATGTRPAPRTAAPTPPACCCTSSRTAASASPTAGAGSGARSSASARSGRSPSSTASASGSPSSRSRARAARRAPRPRSATSPAGASPPTGRPATRWCAPSPTPPRCRAATCSWSEAPGTGTSSTSMSPSRSGGAKDQVDATSAAFNLLTLRRRPGCRP